MRDSGRNAGLEVIFSFFLGLLVTAFFGVGVFTFYPYPTVYQDQIDETYQQEQAVRSMRPLGELSDEEREELNRIAAERQELYELSNQVRQQWRRNTSIVLVTLATLTMAVSLVRARSLPVLSNGLLLGGLFTMVYGVGWIAFIDSSLIRFLVIAVALIVTLILGYIRFVRYRQGSATHAVLRTTSGDLAGLEQRVTDLELRLTEAANALGQAGGSAQRGRSVGPQPPSDDH